MWRLSLAILGPCAVSGGVIGKLSCPCIDTWAWDAYVDNGKLKVALGDEDLSYNLSYGLSTCKAWDYELRPFCAGLPANATPPAWCAEKWCYVDGHNCNLIASQSQYFSDLHYSYMTCGASNSFE